ncbi:hypothetical protein RhiirA4_480330 [Rhizophagus irregularis]|uniref:Uncharacterized protein n=1 Tax=Rhizophagus irregularis TaxID=588596 RepID=A0A2I1HHR3_9GLOM|nr:hypothetical protein RhiirA4_480330 [Rhizophagus irregularis]
MLTVNHWIATGLVNSTMGTVTDILFKEKLEQTALPTVVLVAFDNYSGPILTNLEGIPVIPIIPIRRIWDGLTAAIDLGRKEFAVGLSFVANSCVRSLNDIKRLAEMEDFV